MPCVRQRLLSGSQRRLRRLVDEVSTGACVQGEVQVLGNRAQANSGAHGRLEVVAPGDGLPVGLALGHALENAVRHHLHQINGHS